MTKQKKRQKIKINYHKELEKIINNLEEGERPSLLIHTCCGPCSTYCLDYLSKHFDITVYYYNPNIYPKEEYFFRLEEQRDLLGKMDLSSDVKFLASSYDEREFYEIAKGKEKYQEGGRRCNKCYELRLTETAKTAEKLGFDYFCSSLTISPHKDSKKLNLIAKRVARNYNVKALPSDFKKNNGFKKSVELSNRYGMYRQEYCGCEFSLIEWEKRHADKES